eukprot:7179452-Prymnesium_polylepis.1
MEDASADPPEPGGMLSYPVSILSQSELEWPSFLPFPVLPTPPMASRGPRPRGLSRSRSSSRQNLAAMDDDAQRSEAAVVDNPSSSGSYDIVPEPEPPESFMLLLDIFRLFAVASVKWL